MKSYVLILLWAIIPAAAFAQCDCTIVPFQPDPPCFQECTTKILAKASYKQLTSLFGLSTTISEKVFTFPEKSTATSLESYKKVLDPKEFSTVEATFKHATQDRVTTFYKYHRTEDNNLEQP